MISRSLTLVFRGKDDVLMVLTSAWREKARGGVSLTGGIVMTLLRYLFAVGPLLFGIGFIAPLIAQSLEALALQAPMGLSPLALGLGIGASLGLIATLRGRWV
jgi:hypothetical protein